MVNDYSAEAQEVADAMNAVYENKQINKKNDISGDFDTDNVSYPTVKAVKNRYEGATTVKNQHVHGNISTDGKIGSTEGKVVVTGSNGLLDVASTISSILITNGALPNIGTSAGSTQSQINSAIDNKLNITVERLSVPETGNAASYVVKQNGVKIGDTINIMKDFLLQSASVEIVGNSPTQAESGAGLVTGDYYFKFIVNTSNTESGVTPLIVPMNAFLDNIDYYADESTITKYTDSNDGNKNKFKIKDGGITYNKLNSTCIASLKEDANDEAESEIGLFASALAEAINPSSS